MKKIKKQVLNALDYYKQNPTSSLTKVAQAFNVDRHTMSDYSKLNLDIDKLFESNKDDEQEYLYYFTDEELEYINYYAEHSNEPYKNLKEKYPSAPSVRAMRNWMDILGKNYATGQIKKYGYDRNKFANIVTEEDAYWLGFITADGCIVDNRILQIKLAERDKDHLIKFAKYIGLNDTEIEEIIKDGTGGASTKDNPVVCIKICSTEIVQNLQLKNILPNKSGKEIPYICTSKELEKAYIRGLLDGDGYLRSGEYGLGLVGSKEICQYVFDYICNNITDISNNHIREHGVIWKLELTGKQQSALILKHFYENNKITLTRKEELYNQKYKNL